MVLLFEDRATGIQVTAMKFTGGLLNVEKINNWIRSAGRQSRWELPLIGKMADGSSYRAREEYLEIRTVQGWKPVQLGEWIVRFSSGHFWSFTPEHFRDAYRPVITQTDTKETMNDMNVASYVKRPDEYKALKFDTAESYETMCRWLHDEMAMQRVHWTERFGFIDGPYIEFASFDKPYKVFPGMWVVISEKDGSTEVLHDVAFKQKYMASDPEYRGTKSEYEEAEVASDTAGYDKHDEIVAVNENPEIITSVPTPGEFAATAEKVFKSGAGPVSDGHIGIEKELEQLINRYSGESVSGTPDFILAKFLIESLKNYNEAVSHRAKWRGETVEFKPRPTNTEEPTATL